MLPGKSELVALRDQRSRTIEVLTEAFADDLIDVDAFEHRVDLAHRAESIEELASLRKDLAPEPAEEPATALVACSDDEAQALLAAQPRNRWLVAILGGHERKGAWRVPAKLKVITLLGGAELDFREAILAPGVTTVRILALLGGIEIIVPPTLAVECDGIGILGGFESMERAPRVPDPKQPLLRLQGAAILGGIEISTRLPGESARQARKRRSREKRLKRREQEELKS